MPVAIYLDKGTHFDSHNTQGFLAKRGVLWIPALVTTKKAVRIIKKGNNIIKSVIKKSKDYSDYWPRALQPSVFECNCQEISYLNYSAFEIHYRY
jgi:hypothetical protein